MVVCVCMSLVFFTSYESVLVFSFCLQLEATVVEMQDPKSGVKGSEQKLNVTTIPHVIAGETELHEHTYSQSLRKFLRL